MKRLGGKSGTRELVVADKKMEYSKRLVSDIRMLLWAVTIGGLILAGYCVQKGYTGSLPWLSAMMGLPWTAHGIVCSFYLNMAKSDHKEGGITFETAKQSGFAGDAENSPPHIKGEPNMVRFRQKGDFSKMTRFLESAKEAVRRSDLDRYGREGVAVLASATPHDSGETANSWRYEIIHRKGTTTISFYNSNIQNGVSIAILLQYGHGTRNGGWVQGVDYINPAIQPIFDKIAKEAWREVTSL